MKNITIPVHLDDVLNNFTIEEIIEFYGAENVMVGIPTKELIEHADPDLILESIHEDHPGKIVEFLRENGDENFLAEIDDDLVIQRAIKISEAN